jgi:hypothetical protein
VYVYEVRVRESGDEKIMKWMKRGGLVVYEEEAGR